MIQNPPLFSLCAQSRLFLCLKKVQHIVTQIYDKRWGRTAVVIGRHGAHGKPVLVCNSHRICNRLRRSRLHPIRSCIGFVVGQIGQGKAAVLRCALHFQLHCRIKRTAFVRTVCNRLPIRFGALDRRHFPSVLVDFGNVGCAASRAEHEDKRQQKADLFHAAHPFACV